MTIYMKNRSYTKEYIEDILKQISPPINKKVSEVSKKTGVSPNTIYGWKRKARKEGKLIPNSNPNRLKKWRKEDKLRIVMETFTMNEEELSRYCREYGLYTEDIKAWKKLLEGAFEGGTKSADVLEGELKSEKEKVKELEQDLDKKNKALAETAALLVLRKKADAIWGEPEGE